jgi:hypothetical protein
MVLEDRGELILPPQQFISPWPFFLCHGTMSIMLKHNVCCEVKR